ncbi:MAG: UDP-N-acetylglucosamine--N-acetylmuramyl-(pentapeptide) pyrophosphoryl-undecaprenol N-acetylglucosamine transferase [Saprospiraceae bacterium]|nr:UDP-N-acetylglucosamine--N-acetylmuramyl-(pentapeptide) pyrophosphoryl-undecaprenol N-acetylglucosamine transferase [Saprospiraceae bacterium]
MKQKTVVIAPLNWGLGHATRTMPIIDALLAQGARVILASDGAALSLLQSEYPHLEIYELPAYNIRYPFSSMVLSIGVQMPKILRGCLGEYFWLKKFAKQHKIDVVISDNRFGFFHPKIHSIFMTHQVNLLIHNSFLQKIANAVNHFFIKKFDALWIPDFENEPNLAGQLSHGIMPIKRGDKHWSVQYVGSLSRFNHILKKKSSVFFEEKYTALVVLSGPEPQRTILEEKIVAQFKEIALQFPSAKVVLVRGLKDAPPIDAGKLTVFDFLTADTLFELIMSSEVVVCRSGYSSVMDLAALGKRAILIPTPGQTEQEYLAQKLHRAGIFLCQKQSDLDLFEAFEQLKNYSGFGKMQPTNERLSELITELLKN